MFAATLAPTPVVKAIRADQRIDRPARWSSTIAVEATINIPSTEIGRTYATSGRSPKCNATWTI
jgi:hypothetical protein